MTRESSSGSFVGFSYVVHYQCRGIAPLETLYLRYGEEVRIQHRYLPIYYSFANGLLEGEVRDYLTSLPGANLTYYTVTRARILEVPPYLESPIFETQNNGFFLVTD